MSEVLVKVENVSKKFSKDFKKSLWYGVKDMSSALFTNQSNQNILRPSEFWAVKDVSFELRRGECLGLIGHNGAGKSTLLKILNGLIRPDEGKITMNGRVGALIELGAGFNPILTGRENIYNNGSVLGFSKKEIDAKLETIIEFSEIGEFIDAPVRNYSSGMKVRLGFAVAAQMEPDILIIDEVLAVGDMNFKLKCLRTIDELLKTTAVIFVSHAMPQISRLCNKIILMDHGSCLYNGNDVSHAIDVYYSKLANNGLQLDLKNEHAELLSISIGNTNDQESIPQIKRLEDLVINLECKVKKEYANPICILSIFDNEQKPIGTLINTNGLKSNISHYDDVYNFYKSKVTISRINLSKGIYSITFLVTEALMFKPLFRVQGVQDFQILSKIDLYPPVEFEGDWE
ncbi:ABC transporter ATP-binding protein [Formosa sediminum]|uniref:ABC transporter ATP-binding protein n=1 Tax=Formosa sediminum TaxID=2594004 RepID=A0A516GQ90_9FLAO|nr:ABC transporter ATP-binding protein [Formosa sediminum]QDO93676.1 ABC transporter ATP-binding protein [Formosa sediminum]